MADHCLRSRQYVNVVVAGKQPALQYLSMDESVWHCARGIGIWEWASNDDGDPDVVMACAGDVPTLETLAATALLRKHLPELAVRVINVVDLMRLQPDSEHPHGLPDPEFDALFTTDRPVILAYHGYPSLIHRLTYRRTNHAGLHVRGFNEEGTTTTPFDRLLHDRKRTLELFEFDYYLEMYKPAAKRRWGYFALPVLYGDRLVGKLDATADRDVGVLRVNAVHQDVPFDEPAGAAVDGEIQDLADWLKLDLARPGRSSP